MTRAEVVIVGAGPAGAVTALGLARAGRDVLLLDRAQFPRAKPCGDCLSADAGAALARLGLRARIDALPHAAIRGWRITAGSGCAFEGDFERFAEGDPLRSRALAIERRLLDAALVAAAVDAGVRLRTGVHMVDLVRDDAGRVRGVRALGPNREPVCFAARVVVGADGLRSVVSRRLGLVRRRPRLRKLSLTLHVEGLDGPTETGEMHLFDGGCVGLAPITRGATSRHNLTLVLDGARPDADRRGGPGADPMARMRAALRRVPSLRARRAALEAAIDALPAGVRPLGSGPFDWPTRGVARAGAVLVGDAAGYYDPFTGQGINHALAAAELLVAELAPALAAPDHALAAALRRYARGRRRLLSGVRVLQRTIEACISRPALLDLVATRLRAAPEAADAIVAATGDLIPARALLSPRVAVTFLKAISSRNGCDHA